MDMPSPLANFDPYLRRIERLSGYRWQGRVTQVMGNVIESEGPIASAGDSCEVVNSTGETLFGEVIGFRGPVALSMTYEAPTNVRYGDKVMSWGSRPQVRVDDNLIGRVIGPMGEFLDHQPSVQLTGAREIEMAAPPPFERNLIRAPLTLGIRSIDGFLTCGEGQRLGIFGGSGVGKSTLLGMLARNSSADISILALIGERGREVREFLECSLGVKGRRKAVVVVSTSDQPPLLRVRGALAALAIAEHFAVQGKNVLLFVDSLTRLAMAQREIGLAAGEPPTAKGYTPSVFSMLARLIERAGKFNKGSITGFYTVLMEGDDQQDPIVDGARALLDGHIVLDRTLASRGHYPAISILDSISRLMPAVATPEHMSKAKELRKLLSAFRDSADLVRIGAYQKGMDPTLDRALELMPSLDEFLQQSPESRTAFDETLVRLLALAA